MTLIDSLTAKPLRYWLLSLLFAAGASQAGLTIPTVPLFMTSTGVKPNFILTLDDSGSMSWGHAPDNIDGCGNFSAYSNNPWSPSNSACGPDNYYKAYNYNGIYYNPNTQYTPPPHYNGSTCTLDITNPATCYPNIPFNSAPLTGLSPSTATKFSNINPNCNPAGVNNNLNASPLNLSSNYSATTMFMPPTSGVNGGNLIQVCANPNKESFNSNGTNANNYYPAYYYLLYSNAGLTLAQVRPNPQTAGNCTNTAANQATDNNCYIKINVGSAGGGKGGSGWQYADIYKNPDGTAATVAQKQQNFANWYSYYRTRNLSLVSNAMAAFTGFDDNLRVAWQAINTCLGFSGTTCKGWNNPANGYDQRIQALGGNVTHGIDVNTSAANTTHREELYSWLARLPSYNGTALRTAAINAGNYVATTGAASPLAETPPNTAGTYYSCRRNVHLMMTDGSWNGDTITNAQVPANADSSATVLPNGYTMPNGANSWTPAAPYSNNTAGTDSHTLSDIAFYFWAKDLQTTQADNLSPILIDSTGSNQNQWVNPKNDPATWQHLNTYAIGLGLSTLLTSTGLNWAGDTFSGGYLSLTTGTNWPVAGLDGSGNSLLPGNAYDLWHAAINGRGKFYSASDSAGLKAAFSDVVNTINSQSLGGGGAGLAASALSVSSSNIAFKARANSDWSGTLTALPITNSGTLGTTPYWEASTLLPFANARNIYTLNGANAQAFTSCNGSLATALNQENSVVDGLCAERLAWLRGFEAVTGATWNSGTSLATFTAPSHGFKTNDSVIISGIAPGGYNGTFTITVVDSNTFTATINANPGGALTTPGRVLYSAFRNRETSALGDILNSRPVYSGTGDFGFGSAKVPATLGQASYSAFVATKTSRKPVVYVGANDGMLHAFDAEGTGSSAGSELFAYVPGAVYSNLSLLMDPAYLKSPANHRYFVDGQIAISDAYLADGNSDTSGWNTVLVGGLGAGGASIYALDVTHPSSFGTSDIKWEFSDANLGLTYGQPQIAPDTSNRWVTVFGNGYNSGGGANDFAYLYVVNLSNGALVAKIAAGASKSNGLAAPYLYDADGDKIPEVAYAGDMQGNLWKFVNTAGTWSLGNGGLPLFTTPVEASGQHQPITAQPVAINASSITGSSIGSGVLVYFGTGSYLTTPDLTNSDTQTFYAILDTGIAGTVTRAQLQPQTFITSTSGSATVRTSSNNTPNWTAQLGWYMDFPSTAGVPSERILSAPLVKNFTTIEPRVIFVTTTPTNDPCTSGGTSWLMELDLTNGSGLTAPAIDINGNGNPADDPTVSGLQLKGIGISNTTPTWLDPGCIGANCNATKLIDGTLGSTTIGQTGDPKTLNVPPVPTRIYWQQIM